MSRWLLLGSVACTAFLGSWVLLHHAFWGRHQLVDTPLYERYADAIRAGRMPYRDFALEYPPGALAAFLAPELTAHPRKFGEYGHSFEKWMAACGAGAVIGVVAVLAALRARPWRAAAACALVAISPLLLGSVFLSRFDAWPAMLTVAALAALLVGRSRLSAVVLAAAVAVKLYPLVLVPLALIWMFKERGRRAAAMWAVTFGLSVVVCFAPFVALSPAGVAHSFDVQLGRPLQVESLGAALLVFAHHAFGLKLVVRNGHHSKNVLGAVPHTVAVVTSIVEAALLAIAYALFARGPVSRQRLVNATAACVCVFVGFGKVFSPQYMIWLIPLVPLVAGRAGLFASAALVAALVVTQAWFPSRYGLYADHLRPVESGLVLTRDLLVAGLAVGLVATLRRRRPVSSHPRP